MACKLYGLPPEGSQWTEEATNALLRLVPFGAAVTVAVRVAAGKDKPAEVELTTAGNASVNVVLDNNLKNWNW